MLARFLAIPVSLLFAFSLSACGRPAPQAGSYVELPGEPSVGRADFSKGELAYAQENLGYESYSDLDDLGRCGEAEACLGPETLPDYGEERESISEVHPSGWHSIRFDFVEGESLYNRSHLIGWALSAENANECNLVTGTRYMNADVMRVYEEEVADYIYDTDNHVLYRSTPVFEGDELVCRGVQVEAYSLEDEGRGIDFSVWCPNVQPGVEIDYATGDARLSDESARAAEGTAQDEVGAYILNTNSHKVHDLGCPGAKDIAPWNREEFSGSLKQAEDMGYSPCGQCLS